MTACYWYRVRLDSQGRAVSCERTDSGPSGDAAGVYYVMAGSSVEAQAMAHGLYLNRQRDALRERRERNRRLGLCRCGGNLDTDGRTCRRCRANSMQDKARAVTPGAKPPPKSTAFAAMRSARERQVRMDLIQEVINAHKSMGPGEFARWLTDMAATIAGQEVAA